MFLRASATNKIIETNNISTISISDDIANAIVVSMSNGKDVTLGRFKFRSDAEKVFDELFNELTTVQVVQADKYRQRTPYLEFSEMVDKALGLDEATKQLEDFDLDR